MLPDPVPRLVKTQIEKNRRGQARYAAKMAAALARGNQRAVNKILAFLGSPLAVTRPETNAKYVDRSEAATDARQRKFVEMLCSGGRVNPKRCWSLCYPGKHNQSLGQVLRYPSYLRLFREYIEAGGDLPRKYAARILAALGIDPATWQEDRYLLGLDIPPPPPEPPPPPPAKEPPTKYLGWYGKRWL